MKLLARAGARHLLHHPGQLALALLGIALGVAVVLSIDIAAGSAQRAFALSTQAVTGRATHHIVGGPGGLDEELYVRLRLSGIRGSAPVIESRARARARGQPLVRLLGLDPFAEPALRPGLGAAGADVVRLLSEPGAVIAPRPLAEELGLAVGHTLVLEIDGVVRQVRVVALLEPQDELARRGLADVLIADIATTQALSGMAGRLSRIDVLLEDSDTAALRGMLPPGAELLETGTSTRAVAAMTAAFELNLRALGLLALVFGAFLIYNAVTFSVVQRRTLFGTLRAIGVTRGEVLGNVLAEAAAIGALATALGIALGVALGSQLIGLVTRTINDLYFAVTVREVDVPALSVVRASALGIGATLLAAAVPAWEAASAPPRAALTRSVLEARLGAIAPAAAWLGALAIAVALALLALPSREPLPGFAAMFAIIGGAALLTPFATLVFVRIATPIAALVGGATGRLAAREVGGTLSRTAPAIAALAIAVSVGIAIGTMLGSFPGAVIGWLDATLPADVYVSAPGLVASRPETPLDAAVVRAVVTTPGIAGVTRFRNTQVHAAAGPVRLTGVAADPRYRAGLPLRDAVPDVWARFDGGDVLVSEPLAFRMSLAPGSALELPTSAGPRSFRVAGVFTDYASERGQVFIAMPHYRAHWRDEAVTSLALIAAPGVPVDSLVRAVAARAGTRQHIVVRSSAALRAATLRVFDRTFLVTDVLRLLALGVAFVGIIAALLALQLERARTLSVLRAVGLTRAQLWALVTVQTGFLGAAAALLAVPLGIALSAVMVYVVNRRSFGWTMPLDLDAGAIAQGVAVAVIAALLGGLYPAWRISRTPPALALREE